MSESAISYGRQHRDLVLALRRQVGRLPTAATAQPPEQQIRHFIGTCETLREMEQAHLAFNLFEGLGIQEAEVRHSRILAWLLDPNASHRRGSIHLAKFLSLTTGAETLNEGSGDWQVTCEDHRIDILVKNAKRRFLCAVETKIHAAEGVGQLSRYRELLAERYPDYERHLIYLTLGQEKPTDPAWQTLSLRRMISEVVPEGRAISREDSLRALLFHEYADWIRAGAEPSEGNLFAIMHLASHELRHSNFLGWLLNPRGSHGLGDAFARYFFGLLATRSGKNLSAMLDACKDLQVEREFEHVDLLLLSERCRLAVIVENKINAALRPEQLADYERFINRQLGRDLTLVVYLDMQGRASGHPDAIDLSYADLLPFFDARSADLPPSGADRTATLIDQYRKLLTTKLWTRVKSLRLPPAALDELAARTVQRHRTLTVAVLREVRNWRQGISTDLGKFLISTAKEVFDWEIHRHWPRGPDLHWYTFVPSCLDAFPLLRHSGSNDPYDGRLVVYEFYVNLFAEKFEGRPAQLSLDVKIHAARPGAESLKQHLHDRATQTTLFHRAGNLKTPRKHDILLNHRLLHPEELEFRALDEIKATLEHRLQRFSATSHQEIMAFFRGALAAYPATV